MMRELLFIGGPADGKRIEVDDAMNRVRIPDAETGLTFEYRREWLSDAKKEFEIMFNSAEVRGVIEALLAGYKSPNAE